MKKLLSALISAALIAIPLAVISTPAAAKTTTQSTSMKAKHGKKGTKAKKAKSKYRATAQKPTAQPAQ